MKRGHIFFWGFRACKNSNIKELLPRKVFISVDSAFRMQSKHNDILGTKKTHQTRINQNSREPFCLSHPFEYILFSHCNTAHSRPYLLLLCRCACGDKCYQQFSCISRFSLSDTLRQDQVGSELQGISYLTSFLFGVHSIVHNVVKPFF